MWLAYIKEKKNYIILFFANLTNFVSQVSIFLILHVRLSNGIFYLYTFKSGSFRPYVYDCGY